MLDIIKKNYKINKPYKLKERDKNYIRRMLDIIKKKYKINKPYKLKERDKNCIIKDGRIYLYYKIKNMYEYIRIQGMISLEKGHNRERFTFNISPNDMKKINKEKFKKYMTNYLYIQNKYIETIEKIENSGISYASTMELDKNTSEPNSPIIGKIELDNKNIYRIFFNINWQINFEIKNFINYEKIGKRNRYNSILIKLDEIIDKILDFNELYKDELNKGKVINIINLNFLKKLQNICVNIEEYIELIFNMSKRKRQKLLEMLENYVHMEINLQFQLLNINISR